MSENLKIWNSVEMTDTRYVKKNGNLSAINGQYFYKRATEVFGTLGKGWGYDIVKDELIDSAPMILNKVVIGVGKIHTIKINFWYLADDKKHSFEQFGHTRYMYLANSGKVIVDEDYAKKSLTDAVKKSLSGLGFCADVFLGMFDDSDYIKMVNMKQAEDQAADKKAEINKNKKTLLEWVEKQCGVYSKIPHIQACTLSYDKQKSQIIEKCRILDADPKTLIDKLKSAYDKQIAALGNKMEPENEQK